VRIRQDTNTRATGWRHAIDIAFGLRLAACIAIVAGFSTTASAADANLVLIPDFTGILPLLLLLFVLLMFPANELLFKPIFRVLDERGKRTNGTRRRANKILLDAEKTLADYEQNLSAGAAGSRGYVDAVVPPKETRAWLGLALRTSLNNPGPRLGNFQLGSGPGTPFSAQVEAPPAPGTGPATKAITEPASAPRRAATATRKKKGKKS